MGLYLPDSSALIRFERGHRIEREWFRDAANQGDVLGTCSIVITELYTGSRPERRAAWDVVFSSLRVWQVTLEDARQAGIWRHDLARQGVQVHLPDATIAAVAERVRATIVTDNLKDFRAIGAPAISLNVQGRGDALA